jgi:DNA-binding beta-propeller fold protein YncE
MKKLFFTLAALTSAASAGTLYMGAYPNAVLVFDEAQGKIVDRIPITTGLPSQLRLSQDRKKIFVSTLDHSGIEIIDIATRKVVDKFTLNTETKRYRMGGGAPDPEGKLIYTTTTEIDKQVDRYEVAKPKYTVIDVAQHKIARTVDIPREEENALGGGRGGPFEVSPDGKYLYQFRDKVIILNTSDFKEVERIELAKPELPSMETVGFGGLLDSLNTDPSQRVTLFNSTDPIVHNRVFGIGRFDMSTRHFTFNPIGPAPAAMAGFHVAPDKKAAYTIISNGTHGNRRCEFWAFDLGTNRIAHTAEVPCRSRFSFGLSTDGKKLYIYGAGFEIEVYDAATLKHEKTWDLNNDVTGSMIALP